MTLFKALFQVMLFVAVAGIELRAQSAAGNSQLVNRDPNDSSCAYAESRIKALGNDSLLIELGEIDKVNYAAKGNRLYTRRKDSDDWLFFASLPFYTDSIWGCGIYNRAVAYRITDDSIGLYHPGNAIITYTTVSAILDNFLKEGIEQVCVDVTVSIIMTKCDTMYNPKSCYKKQGNTFHFVSGEVKKPMVMNGAEFDSLVAAIPRTFSRNCFLDSLGFHLEDYQQCKQEIIQVRDSVQAKRPITNCAFQLDSAEYVDFVEMLSMVDSVKSIDKDSLFYDLLFWGVAGGRWGHFVMEFTNKQGQVVALRYTGCPWGTLFNKLDVSIGGLSWWSTASSPFIPYFRARNPDLFPSLASAKANLLRSLVQRCYYYYYK